MVKKKRFDGKSWRVKDILFTVSISFSFFKIYSLRRHDYNLVERLSNAEMGFNWNDESLCAHSERPTKLIHVIFVLLLCIQICAPNLDKTHQLY